MKHGPYCIEPDEVGAPGVCVCDGTDETIAAMERQYAREQSFRVELSADDVTTVLAALDVAMARTQENGDYSAFCFYKDAREAVFRQTSSNDGLPNTGSTHRE